MCPMAILPLTTVSFILSYISLLSSQDLAVGLYYPELRAVRTMFEPARTPDLPSRPGADEPSHAWAEISEGGRDLLMNERDIALVVVDSKGNWRYRSTGVCTLRSLVSPTKQTDLDNLLRIVGDFWFKNLRDFYDGLLYKRDGKSLSYALGPLLDSVDDASHVTEQRKDWFRSIVGAEIQRMDTNTRTALLENEGHRKLFTDAVAVAEATRKAQLQSVVKALTPNAKPLVNTISLSDLSIVWPAAQRETDIWRELYVKKIGGNNLVQVSSGGRILWIATKGQETKNLVLVRGLISDEITKIYPLLENGEVKVFVGDPGASTVYGVKLDQDLKE